MPSKEKKDKKTKGDKNKNRSNLDLAVRRQRKTMNRQCGKRFRSEFKSMDMFGIPITLNYKGKGTFQTYWGAAISVVIGFIMAVYMIDKVKNLVFRNDPVTNRKTLFNPIENFEEHLNPFESGFNFAFQTQSANYEPLDETFLKINVGHVTFQRNEDGTKTVTSDPISYGSCDIDKLYGVRFEDESKRNGAVIEEMIKSYKCPSVAPQDQTNDLSGNFYSEKFEFIKVSVVPCIGHDHCAPLEAVKKALFGARLDFLYLNAFVDFDAYDSEIQ